MTTVQSKFVVSIPYSLRRVFAAESVRASGCVVIAVVACGCIEAAKSS